MRLHFRPIRKCSLHLDHTTPQLQSHLLTLALALHLTQTVLAQPPLYLRVVLPSSLGCRQLGQASLKEKSEMFLFPPCWTLCWPVPAWSWLWAFCAAHSAANSLCLVAWLGSMLLSGLLFTHLVQGTLPLQRSLQGLTFKVPWSRFLEFCIVCTEVNPTRALWRYSAIVETTYLLALMHGTWLVIPYMASLADPTRAGENKKRNSG